MFLNQVLEADPDPIFGMLSAYEADARPAKINLMVGIYKDENLRAELMPVVRKTKEKIVPLDMLADYLPMDGIGEFGQLLGSLVFGKSIWNQHHGRIYAAQTVGGTAALRVGAEFMAQQIGRKIIFPQPTWANHRNIAEKAGLKVETIPYYNREQHKFDLESYLEALNAAEERSIVLLHAACHNPTGCDPTLGEWKEISNVCKKRNLLPFFDFAYQGFGNGIEEDAGAIRLFFEEGHEMFVAYSCSKNFSLYCQRVGALFAICPSSAVKMRVGSQIKRIIRALYSNPPAHGAKIVLQILKDPELHKEWNTEVGRMRQRLSAARESLVYGLISKAQKADFSFLKHHLGMFSYLDLTKSQVQELIQEYGIYTLDSGRINVGGITERNISRIVEGVLSVVEK